MTQLTIEIPKNLARRLKPVQNRMVEIIELGLHQIEPSHTNLYSKIIEFLASGPTPEEIIALRPSETVQERIGELLDKNRAGTLAETEEAELDEYQTLNHMMTLVKIRARQNLSKSA